MPIEAYQAEGTTYKTKDGIYIFRDNGANVLAVAHLDTVKNNGHFYEIVIDDVRYVINAQLDDRLGAYIILDLLPQLGLGKKYDILLTTGEESGHSTAKHFKAPKGKSYNWIFSFDRRGDDVVMYQYDTYDMRELLKKYLFTPGYGSFSDIGALDELGVTGFNFGCGYKDEHTSWCIANLRQTAAQVNRFYDFLIEMGDTKLEFTPKPSAGAIGHGGRYWNGGYDADADRFPHVPYAPPIPSSSGHATIRVKVGENKWEWMTKAQMDEYFKGDQKATSLEPVGFCSCCNEQAMLKIYTDPFTDNGNNKEYLCIRCYAAIETMDKRRIEEWENTGEIIERQPELPMGSDSKEQGDGTSDKV